MTRDRSVQPRRGTCPLMAGLLAVVVSATLSACGISTDTAPRDIAPSADAAVADQADDDNTATGSGQVYFVQVDASGAPSRLVAVARDVSIDRDPTAVLDVLIDGPNEAERGESIASLLPPDLQVLGWSARPGGVLAIDVNAEMDELTGSTLIVALAQIVYTVGETARVEGVRITVEGGSRAWPDGNGQLQDDALTVFDYPGLVRSSQPAFPAIPSGRPDSA